MNDQETRPAADYETIDHTTPLYTIGVAAKLTGTTVSTIRMYEEKGLIIPYKTPSGHRQFSDTDIIRIRCIREYLDRQGLNIAGIRAIMALVPCWLLKPCSDEDRRQCDAFTSNTEPCWAVAVKGLVCIDEDCRTCPVYHIPDRCRDVKSLYKELMEAPRSA
ncbi:MAG: MerR family transcriptional regulator [Fidelibacterota bacterium]|nr:MAG: MerR family transcriptional regulator [Candidatus Neomarinimicrobiota bacterium]